MWQVSGIRCFKQTTLTFWVGRSLAVKHRKPKIISIQETCSAFWTEFLWKSIQLPSLYWLPHFVLAFPHYLLWLYRCCGSCYAVAQFSKWFSWWFHRELFAAHNSRVNKVLQFVGRLVRWFVYVWVCFEFVYIFHLYGCVLIPLKNKSGDTN